jgi:eukaryotic-like serine/threonine-protein kinase
VVTGEALRRTDSFGLTGKLFEGRFQIECQVAEGGFAVVYRARHLALDRPVALKVLKMPRGYDEAARAEFQEKFGAEAKTIARLKHPHIVDVYDFAVGVAPSGEPAPWMALEWLDGDTLATQLSRRRQQKLSGLAPHDALAFIRPVVEALAFAHKQGIVHRDVKPANVMVATGDHPPSLQVLDFGIAKLVASERQVAGSGDTRTDSVPTFSPTYAAPEQVQYSRTGPWTDVHALGLILTELLTDEAPYPDTDAHLFEQVMATVRPTPGSKGRDAGPFEPVLAKALALSPRERWSDAGDLLAALDEADARATSSESTVRMPAPAARVSAAVKTVQPAAQRSTPPRSVPVLVVATALVVTGIGVSIRLGRRAGSPPTPIASAPLPPAASVPRPPATPIPPQDIAAAPALPPPEVRPKHTRSGHPVKIRENPTKETQPKAPVKDLFDDTK